ncbi:MAG: TSUP family transporter [Sphaerochaetaceae bacterium]|nr:TSUP family transporter [Sphaerochaetaceae bacterium]
MDLNILWALCPILFIAGFIDSIAGGGGLISLTAYSAMGLNGFYILGTNKFSSCIGTTVASVRYLKRGFYDVKSVISACLGSFIGSYLGSNLVLRVDEKAVSWMLLILVPIICVFVLFKKDFGEKPQRFFDFPLILISIGIGFSTGFYDGFFGPGTGLFITLLFTGIVGMELKKACGNARLINLASNIAALYTFILNGQVYFYIGIPCAICSVLGNYFGSGLVMKNGKKIVKPIMVLIVFLLLLKVFIDLIFRG